MATVNARRSCGINHPNSVELQKAVGGPSTPKVMEKFESQGRRMAPQALPFLLKKCHSISIHDLARFWSDPTVCEYTRGEMARSAARASWFMAMTYLTVSKVPEARALTFNGCFLYDCLQTSIEDIVKMCGENFPNPVSVNKSPFYTQRFYQIHTPHMLKCFLAEGLPAEFQNQMRCFSMLSPSTPGYSRDKKMRNYEEIACDRKSSSTRNHHKPSSEPSVGTQIQLFLADGTNDGQGHSFNIGPSTTLKVVLNSYADKRGVSLRSLRFSHRGKILFLSSVGNKTPGELNLGNRDVINVTDTRAPTQESNGCSLNQINATDTSARTPASSGSLSQMKTSTTKKARSKNSPKKKGRCKKKAPAPQEKPVETLEESRAQHSRMLTKLHEELQPRLKELRDRLNALGLERQPPKKKKRNKRRTKTKESADRRILPSSGSPGKAGKSCFIIQVGEVENLHKTKKSWHLQQSGTSATLDLRGYTKNEALNALNEKLPEWVDAAMREDYPWVIPVQIICGCGGHVLSVAVQEWIKSTRNVINAPKKFVQ